MESFGEKIMAFNAHLELNLPLPDGIEVMNPFKEGNAALIQTLTAQFYGKFYADNHPRTVIFGINPGRHGAGLTGVPFTDTKRLADPCGITVSEIQSHELSSVFVYKVIEAYGGPEAFYQRFFFANISPLGFLKPGKTGKLVNYNYYDSKSLENAVLPFIVQSIEQQIEIGAKTDCCFVMGKGKNFKFFERLNQQYQWFEAVIPLEHPRYIMQYKTKLAGDYVDHYLKAFSNLA